MSTTCLERLEDKINIYLNELNYALEKLNAEQDKILLHKLREDKRYQLFQSKIVSLKAYRNSEHYSKFDYVPKKYLDNSSWIQTTIYRDNPILIRNELHIKFIDDSTWVYKYCEDIDGNSLVDVINDTGVDLPIKTHTCFIRNSIIIEEMEELLIKLGMDPSHSIQLLNLMWDIIIGITRDWEEE